MTLQENMRNEHTRLARHILALSSFEIFYGIRLDLAPGDTATLHNLAILLVLIYLYGIARAWDLVGVRQFDIQEVLSPLISKGREQSPSDEPRIESKKDVPR